MITAPAYDLGGAVSKAVELLMSVFEILDELLLKIHETYMDPFSAGIGGDVFEWLRFATWSPLFFLAMAFVWNLAEGAIHKAKHLGEANFPMENLKKCLQILIFATLAIGSRAALSGGPMNSSYMGISYQGIVGKLDNKTTTAALQPLIALDVVSSFASALSETSGLRQQKILAEIARRDPEAGRTYANLAIYVYSPAESAGFVDLLKAGMNTVGNLFKMGPQYFGRQFLNTMIFGMTIGALIIVMSAFLYQAGRTIILLVFYLKLASLLTLMVVPFAIGVLYFKSLRGMGISILKHLLVLMIVAGTLNSVVQTVFTQKVMTQTAALAMKSALKPLSAPVTDNDILMFEAALDADAVAKSMNMPQSQDVTGNLTVQDAVHSCMAMIKVMFILGTMLVLISRLVELFSGLINGHWDPFQQAAQSAG